MAGTGNTSVRSYNFFASGTIAAGGFAANQFDFIDVDDGTPFTSKVVIVANDGAATINIRFSPDPGTGALHGAVLTTEQLSLEHKRAQRIFLDGTPGTAFRVFAH